MDEIGEKGLMTERVVFVKGDAGVHARPAMMMVKEAMKYTSCAVTLLKDDIEADCKSIMSVLGLAIISGTRLIIRAHGENEADAVRNIAEMIENDFNMQ